VTGDGIEQDDDAGDLMLRQQADLQVELGASVGRRHHAVLADQDEGRQEDGLQRPDHGQQAEGIGIEGGDGQPAEVDRHPSPDHGQMQVDEDHAAGEGGDPVRQALLGSPAALRLLAQRDHGGDVAGQDIPLHLASLAAGGGARRR
jgi:hypothetical protein